MVRAIRLSLESVDRGLEQAARTWAGTVRHLLHHPLPLVMPGILTGVILAFARSLSEFGATITFVSNIPGETRTLPIALYAPDPGPGRGRRRAALVHHFGGGGLRGAHGLGNPVAPGPGPVERVGPCLTCPSSANQGEFRVDVTLQAGNGVTTLFGPSGSGKTSVINMVAGLARPDQGRIVVDDRGSVRCCRPYRRSPRTSPPGLCVPGRAAVSPSVGAGQPEFRPRPSGPVGTQGGFRRRHRRVGYRPSAGSPPGIVVRRRKAACRHWPCSFGQPAHLADGRTAGGWTPTARPRCCPSSVPCPSVSTFPSCTSAIPWTRF